MAWQDYIHRDPDILVGKPVVRGTRLAVDFILGLFAVGWTERQILDSYPQLTPEALHAVFAFAAQCVRDESLEGRFTVIERSQARQRLLP